MKNYFKIALIIILTAGIAVNTTAANLAKESTKKVNMILDIDTGIDDALALAYALGCEDINLLGVVGSYGNVSLDKGIENSLNLLKLLGKEDIPVYAGAECSLIDNTPYLPSDISKFIHGNNGIGEIEIPQSASKKKDESGVDFMIRMANEYKKDLTIVAVGPLTNVAKAIQKDPQFAEKVGRIVIMGGAVLLPGNVSQLAEANIYQDSNAANIVFTSKAKVTMVGLDVTMRTIFTKKETQNWRNIGTVSAKKYADMVDFYINAYATTQPELNGCALHDPLAVAVAVDPSLVQTFEMNMKVGTTEADFGRTIGDKARLLEENPNVSICINVDHKEFNSRFYTVLANLFKKN